MNDMSMRAFRPDVGMMSAEVIEELNLRWVRPRQMQKARGICAPARLRKDLALPYAAFVWATLTKTAMAAHLFAYDTPSRLMRLLQEKCPKTRWDIDFSSLTRMVAGHALPPPQLVLAVAGMLRFGCNTWLESFHRACRAFVTDGHTAALAFREEGLAAVRPPVVEITQEEIRAQRAVVSQKNQRVRAIDARMEAIRRGEIVLPRALPAPPAPPRPKRRRVNPRHDKMWAQAVARLAKFKEEGKPLHVSKDDLKNYDFVRRLKKLEREGLLPEERKKELTDLGMVWEQRLRLDRFCDRLRARRFEAVRKGIRRAKEGKSNILLPQTLRWCMRVLKMELLDRLNPHFRQRLAAIGFFEHFVC